MLLNFHFWNFPNFQSKIFSIFKIFSLLEIRHPEELSLCKPLDIEHLRFNYGEVKQAEEKKRRVTLGSMPSQCQKRDAFSTTADSEKVMISFSFFWTGHLNQK